MAQKENRTDQFISAMFNLSKSLKRESDLCCKLCGGVNEKELLIIVFVGQHSEVKMSDLANTLEAPLSTLTSIIDNMVAKKYLSRYHSEEDRRVIKVQLAQNGKSSYKAFLALKEKVAANVLAQFSEKEQVLFLNHIHKLAESLKS